MFILLVARATWIVQGKNIPARKLVNGHRNRMLVTKPSSLLSSKLLYYSELQNIYC